MGLVAEKTTDGAVLSNQTFGRFREFVQQALGIKMPDAKRTLLQGRLQKRMRKIGIATFEDYYEYVFSDEGRQREIVHMMDAITTNKTDFFREPKHFEYLIQTAIPALLCHNENGQRRPLIVWSAGCSSGQEPYTLAMVLSEFGQQHRGFRFSILATDISTKVLDTAIMGVYDERDVIPVSMHMKRRYLLRSKDKSRNTVRIAPELRAKVSFRRLNFMQEDYNIREPVDIIFFRNVLIYFSRKTQETVINRLCTYLKPNGYFFAGHSETLSGLKVPLVQIGSTIYQRKDAKC